MLRLSARLWLIRSVMQIGDEYYEDLTPETTIKVLDALTKGQKPKPGPQSGRQTSENSAGLTALTSKVSEQPFAGLGCAYGQPPGPGELCVPEFA